MRKMLRIGFIVNPIAGMGGSVGLKGTDGDLFLEAVRRGAKPVAPGRAKRFLNALMKYGRGTSIHVSAANGVMGCNYLIETGYPSFSCIPIPKAGERTTRSDTVNASRSLVDDGVDLIVFVGGDGTARDIASTVDRKVPILGIPSGVKMYSGVFASSPEAAAVAVTRFAESRDVDVAEVADADEEAIARGILRVRVFGYVLVPNIPGLIVPSKDFGAHSDESEEKIAIANYFVDELMGEDVLYLLGPGSTVKAIADALGQPKTLLGFDALLNGRIIKMDLGENEILDLLKEHSKAVAVITVIGRQGYLIGRGNQQLSPRVLRTIGGKRGILPIATPTKLRGLKYVLIDTGDPALDKEMSGFYRFVTGFREETIVRAVPASDPELLSRLATQ